MVEQGILYDPLGPRLLRSVAGAFGLALSLALSASLVRLLPWLLDPRVSWATAGVFARGLSAVSVELAAAVALPVGAALAAAAFNERGEGLACLLTGASPWRLSAAALRRGALLALLGGAAGQSWWGEAARPGEAASALIEAARSGCDGRARPVSEVPGLGASWLCLPGEAPWLVVTPGDGLAVQARRASVAPDGGRLWLGPSRWSWRGPPGVEVEVDEAEVIGGRPAAPPTSAPRWSRGLAMASALLGAWAAAAALLASGEARVLAALALGVAAALGPVWLRGEVDAGRLRWGWLALQPALAALPAALALRSKMPR